MSSASEKADTSEDIEWVTVQAWGNTEGIPIPKDVREAHDLELGDQIAVVDDPTTPDRELTLVTPDK